MLVYQEDYKFLQCSDFSLIHENIETKMLKKIVTKRRKRERVSKSRVEQQYMITLSPTELSYKHK